MNAPEIVVSSSPEDPEWDRFVIDGPNPHHEQTALWGRLQTLRGWRPMRVMMRQANTLVGGAQILERQVGRIGKIGYLSRGPLTVPDDAALRRSLLSAIRQIAKQQRLAYLAVTLPYPGHFTASDLEAGGFSVRHERLPPTTPMAATITLDLTQDLEAILAQMRSTTRRSIRQGQHRGATVREGGAEDVDTFDRLLASLCERRGVQPNIPQGDFTRELWKSFAPGGYLKLLVVERDNEVLTTLLVFAMGLWARAWRVGWSGRCPGAHPNELVYWEAIKWAKANGCRFFDIVGFDTGNARAILEGRAIPEGERCGMSDFKLGFGGRVMLLPPGYCYFSNPIVRLLYRTIGVPLLDSKVWRARAFWRGYRERRIRDVLRGNIGENNRSKSINEARRLL
jgi:lipid II:glycine glycyltransferase (peptidoglycan interpeptide bridge formation enzyme)